MHAYGVDLSDIIPHMATRLFFPKKGNGPRLERTIDD